MKVRVYRVGAQLAAAGGMAAAAAGCGDLEKSDSQEDVGEASSPFFGGDVTFDINGWPGGPQTIQFAVSQATTDEFLRVGQKVKFNLPALTLWDWLYPGGGTTPTLEQLQKLAATVAIVALDQGKPFSTQEVETVSFSGADIYSARIETSAAVIPHKTDTLHFALKLTDTSNNTSTDFMQDQFAPRPVFGGALPDKNLLFDSTPAFRQRVIEGDDPVAGANVLFGYTDWRADTLVDAATMDRQIGTIVSGGRMGPMVVPLYGTLVHEVSYAVFFDDAQGWRPEAPLVPNTSSLTLGSYRTCYEASLAVPGKATRMSLYVHVKTTLHVNYPADPSVVKWYNEGDVLPRADKYDNPGGQAFVNYDFSVEN